MPEPEVGFTDTAETDSSGKEPVISSFSGIQVRWMAPC
jgi:hypothetical protein